MGPIDPESSPSNPAPPEIAPHLAPAGEKAILEKYGRLLAIAVVAAIIAGVASSLAGERILDGYHADLYPKLQQHPDPEDMQRWRDARLYSATWTFTAMGGLIGLAMGLAGGVARRSVLASAGAAILGLLLGTSAGASLSLVLVSSFFKRHDPQSGDLVLPLAHSWCDLVGHGCDRGPGVRAGARRSKPLESNSGGGARRCRRGDGHLRDRRGDRLRVQQDGPPAVSLDRDTGDGPITGRDPGGGWGGLGLASIPEVRGLLVRPLLSPRGSGSGRIRQQALYADRRPA